MSALQSSAMPRPRYVYYLAVSLDGFIAEPDGGVDWLNDFHGEYGISDFFRSIDAMVMGRKTYEVALKLGGVPKSEARTIVLSRKLKSAGKNAEVWRGTVTALAKDLAARKAKRVWVMGGGITASSFLDEGLLDEIEVTTMPIVLGEGIPMFGKLRRHSGFRLESLQKFDDGVVLRKYVNASAASRPKRAKAKPVKARAHEKTISPDRRA
jgi:dihydrofolate reductase